MYWNDADQSWCERNVSLRCAEILIILALGEAGQGLGSTETQADHIWVCVLLDLPLGAT